MGFSVKLAPGVRVRASSRGLRTSVGPRAARVHIGAGRTAVSTGFGGFSAAATVGGRSSPHRPSTGVSSRALAQAAKAEQAEELAAALQAILELHRPDFAPAHRLAAPAPPAPDAAAITAKHRKAALVGVGFFNRKGRAQARAAAERAAQAEIAEVVEQGRRQQARHQLQLDQLWQRLVANDPETVMATLAEAFEDNEAAAAPLGADGSEASLVVMVPSATAVPERHPSTTPAGNLTLKKLTKREAADFYKLVVCGYVLVTIKEAFAVAPGLSHVRIVAVRDTGPDAYGNPRLEAVLAARFARQALQGIRWATANAHAVVNDASDQLSVRLVGPSKELAAIDLTAEPHIGATIEAIDASELAR